MKVVVGELEVEEGRLGLLELARDRQHVVRESRRLGEGDVDDHHELERRERLAHAHAVGDGMRRIAALDQHRAEAPRVIGEDLLRHHVAGREPADDLRAGHGRRAALFAVEGACDECARPVIRALLAEVPGQKHEQLVQVRDQRGVQVHLHAEVLERGHALGRRDAARRAARTCSSGTPLFAA